VFVTNIHVPFEVCIRALRSIAYLARPPSSAACSTRPTKSRSSTGDAAASQTTGGFIAALSQRSLKQKNKFRKPFSGVASGSIHSR
jgi:hypothetical protein